MIRPSTFSRWTSFISSTCATLATAVLLTGCGDYEAPAQTTPPNIDARGTIVSSEEIKSYSREELADIIALFGIPDFAAPKNGIHVHRITYRTPDVGGELTSASGMLIVPDVEGSFPVLSDQHGTQVKRRLTISDPFLETELGGVALGFAAQGWVVAGADYLGLGVSEGLHPYYHAETEGSASLDFLRSVRHFVGAHDISLTNELFLTGYSQGAHVTMALHRALDKDPTSEWNIVASAPMAGAYDLADTSLPAALTKPAASSALYVTYALLAYDRVYDIYTNPSEIFQAPYDTQVESLFDGTHEMQEIVGALPATPADLLKPAFVNEYLSNTNYPLRGLLRQNDVLDWKPSAPITLFHGKADVDVPFANAEHALSELQSRGAEVTLVNVGDELDHATAAMPSYFRAQALFESLRAGQ